MGEDAEIETLLASVSASLNDQGLEDWDRVRVQRLVDDALDGAERLEVDDGGGLHSHSGTRVGALRRTPSGEWIAERQNVAAANSDAVIPAGTAEADGL